MENLTNTFQDLLKYLQANPLIAVLLVVALYYAYTTYNQRETFRTVGGGMREYAKVFHKENRQRYGANCKYKLLKA
jgi:hypothetical protein